MIRFFTHSAFHGKSELTGSDFIRCKQLIKHWPEADLYKYGENPETLIFNKVFCSDDYKFPEHFEGKKILDICDPMWLEGSAIVETCHAMDVVTTSTEPLAAYIRQFHKKVVVVPDRFDLSVLPAPKEHKGKAKTVVWFGYSHNSHSLKPAMSKVDELNLNLIIISDQDPLDMWHKRDDDRYTFVKYNEDTIYEELQKADYALLPDGVGPKDMFKSNNRTVKAQLAGLPVAKTPEEMDLYAEEKNRIDWFNTSYDKIKAEYDVKLSVKELKEIINEISENSVGK